MKQFTAFLLLIFIVAHPYAQSKSVFNGVYSGNRLSRVAFPIGGMGAGMFCVEGTGAISHMSVRNHPDVFNEPTVFAALTVKDKRITAKVLEGPVPVWKKFGGKGAADGARGSSWGLARFSSATFLARFPFADISLRDTIVPVKASLKAWSPFIPGDTDASSLPVGALEYTFVNPTSKPLSCVFSFHAANFMKSADNDRIRPISNGFILSQDSLPGQRSVQGDFAIFSDDAATVVDHAWFRGGWFDPLSMAWNHVRKGELSSSAPLPSGAPGASLYVPFTLAPGSRKTIRVYTCWVVPYTDLHFGWNREATGDHAKYGTYQPWYAGRFNDITEIADYWKAHYIQLRKQTLLFTDAFYRSTLPAEVIEAVAANLSILKSPTVLRQTDGRFWGWEGCQDDHGSCPGSCTHVWNYAQALPHLFPALERSLRETEFNENQDSSGHQSFRAMIPIRPMAHDFYAAADGQLGGVLKIYRDWRISGDSLWLRSFYPKLKSSLDYCIRTWDPRHTGTLEEPHHNTYDIEFWGANGMTTSFYLGALQAFIEISNYLGEEAKDYQTLYTSGKHAMETELYNGEYFDQQIRWQGLNATDPVEAAKKSFGGAYSPEAIELLQKEGPKYQYGKGCLSDGVVGAWMAWACGIPVPPVDAQKIKKHLLSVYRYNFKPDLSAYSNPQRSTYASGNEGGLLLCTWPKGGELSLPFVYSNEVWTGVEYEVASHLISIGEVQKGLNIVRTTRQRYDGQVRNPFNEYECGHWYARAMSSYALLEAVTGVRYDAVTRTLYVDSRVGDFTTFLSTNSGFGNVIFKNGKVKLHVKSGTIGVEQICIAGKCSLSPVK